MRRLITGLAFGFALLSIATPAHARTTRVHRVVRRMYPERCSWRTSDGGRVVVTGSGNYCVATRYDSAGNATYSSPVICQEYC